MTQPSLTADPRSSWLPSWPLIGAKLLELRKRRVLITVVVLFTVGLPVVFLGIREIFHLADPKAFSPAGSPAIFASVSDIINELAFIVVVMLGATAGTTDLSDGMFRHLVITGRSRLALFLARIPAGLAIILPLAGAGFAIVCLVTTFLGIPQSGFVHDNGLSIPAYLDQAQLHSWLLSHPHQAANALIGNPPASAATERSLINQQIGSLYGQYVGSEATSVNPSATGMLDAGLWIELDLIIGFTAGLGLGSIMGQRTVPVILMTFVYIIITPLFASHQLPYFIDGQRLLVGVAMDQIQPTALTGGATIGPGAAQGVGHPALLIPPMPTWAVVAVIAGWIVGWSAIGAWRMIARDA
jgi:hypothetical protein